MAICRKCHKTIPEGMMFCTECENSLQNQADESYLDSLLSSVSGKKTANAVEIKESNKKVRKSNNDEIIQNKPDVPVDIPVSAVDTSTAETVVTEETITESPIGEELVTEEPLIEELITEEPIIEESIIEEPIIDEPIIEETIIDKAVIGDSIIDEPIFNASITENEVSEALISDNDSADEGILFDNNIPEEMPVDDLVSDTAINDELIIEDNAANDISVTDDMPVDTSFADEYISDDVPADTSITDEYFTDEVSADIVSVDEYISDEASADEFINDITEKDVLSESELISDQDIPVDSDLIGDINIPSDIDLPSDTDIISDIDLPSDTDIISDIDVSSVEDISSDIEIPLDIEMPSESDIPVEPDISLDMDIPSEAEAVPEFEDITTSEAEEESVVPEDVDMLLDSLLADMDAAGSFDQPQEEMLAPDDLSDIFSALEEEHEPESAVSEESLPDELTIIDDPISAGLEFEAPSDDLFNSAPPEIEMPATETSNIENSIDFLSEDDLEKANNEIDLLPIGDFNIDSVLNDIDSGFIDNQLDSLDEEKVSKKTKKAKKEGKKQSFWQKIFGNVVEELTPEEIEARKQKEIEAEEKKKADAELKAKRAQESKEEKAARKAEEKAAKEEAAKKKAEEKKKKAEEAKEKARQKKEAKLALEELDVNEGRINRIGSTILFVIFAILTIFIIVGSNIYSYNLSIRNAQKEFDIHHYNDAYYEVYGLDIHDEDIELYDQIMTVMYVNTQLNAYEYYMTSNNKDKALDSLLRGLQRYDKYLELATKLDIEDDLNYVKNNILTELDSSFKLSETEAYNMIALRDDVDYSEYIYSLLGEYEVDFSGKNSSN